QFCREDARSPDRASNSSEEYHDATHLCLHFGLASCYGRLDSRARTAKANGPRVILRREFVEATVAKSENRHFVSSPEIRQERAHTQHGSHRQQHEPGTDSDWRRWAAGAQFPAAR